MGQYVDGFVIPIKKKNLKQYKKMALVGRKVWMEHGALNYYECVGEDLKVKFGMTFPKMCKLKSDETVVFSFIVFKSKAHRNLVNKKAMNDPRLTADMEKMVMPFDMKRFSMGGFKAFVTASK